MISDHIETVMEYLNNTFYHLTWYLWPPILRLEKLEYKLDFETKIWDKRKWGQLDVRI